VFEGKTNAKKGDRVFLLIINRKFLVFDYHGEDNYFTVSSQLMKTKIISTIF
jgi:hypothetical protein